MKLLHRTAVILALSLFLHLAGNSPARSSELAKDFELNDLNGKTYRLSELRGTVVLINFWATWCKHCVKENPALDRLYKKLRDYDFHVLSISVDRSASTLEKYLEKNPLSFPVLLDSKGHVFVRLYTVMGIPVTYLIDREGYINEKFIGEQDFDSPAYVDKITSLIEKGGGEQ